MRARSKEAGAFEHGEKIHRTCRGKNLEHKTRVIAFHPSEGPHLKHNLCHIDMGPIFPFHLIIKQNDSE